MVCALPPLFVFSRGLAAWLVLCEGVGLSGRIWRLVHAVDQWAMGF
jgi:hypothetical protein